MRFVGGALVFVFLCGCHTKTAGRPAAAPPVPDMVALLPDPETKAVGRAVVSSPLGGSVELADERATTRVMIGQNPSAPFTISDAAVQRLFGDALAALPLAPRQFLLYFESGTDQLTQESENRLPEILAFVKNRPTPDVTVLGHTDTTGTIQANIELGLQRATMIRDRLVAAGLNANLVSVASHGKADLLVTTPDETPEPRNRRVEVSVR